MGKNDSAEAAPLKVGRKATIHDVAEKAGVSIATVSRVINNNCFVEPETIRKVEKAIADTGYYPNAIARTMRSNKSLSIGLIVSDLANNQCTVIATRIGRKIAARGYSLIVSSSDGSNKSEADYLQTMMSKKVDGMVVHTNGGNDRLISELSRQIPVICFYRRVRDEKYRGDFVGTEDFDAAYRLANHIVEMGHRRIGVINSDTLMSTAVDRLAGLTQSLREAGIRMPASLVHHESFHFETGINGAKKLLAAKQRPTILVALSNIIGLGVLTYLKEQRLTIPDKISFACFGEMANRELLFIEPTIVAQYPEKIGDAVGDLLLSRLDGSGDPAKTIIIPSRLVIGNSIARIEK